MTTSASRLAALARAHGWDVTELSGDESRRYERGGVVLYVVADTLGRVVVVEVDGKLMVGANKAKRVERILTAEELTR